VIQQNTLETDDMAASQVLPRTYGQAFPSDIANHYQQQQRRDSFAPQASNKSSPPQTYVTYNPYPVYSGLQTATNGPKSVTALNRPRKLSTNSTVTVTSVESSPRSTFSGTRTPSWGSMTSVGTRPDLSRKSAMSAAPVRRRASPPNEIFSNLPVEVLQLVAEKLKDLHLDRASDSCSTCWMRDLCSISLTCHKWAQVAQAALYTDIQFVGTDSASHRKRLKTTQGARLMILRRTLRARPHLAALVRSFKAPSYELSPNGTVPKGSVSLDQYEDLVATIVMACPNFEVLAGPLVGYQHSFKKIFHALSTRKHLREMNWLIEAPPAPSQGRGSSPQMSRLPTPTTLDLAEQVAFFDMHANWKSLTTLSIQCQPGATLAPGKLLGHVIKSLPALQHLHLYNVPSNAFNDDNLLSLPALQSLTLSHINGITSQGLSAFATRSNSASIRKLQLRHTPLTSLPALARILSNLRSLESLALIQAFSPSMPDADSFTLWMMPYLASSSLTKLHWDITSTTSMSEQSDAILAQSIHAGGFPKLRQLRVPNDAEGMFQELCRPRFRIDLPADRFLKPRTTGASVDSPQSSIKSPVKLRKASISSSSSMNLSSVISPCTNLGAARLEAQSRIELARQLPKFTVNVFAEGGTLEETHQLGSFIGTIGSLIEYQLVPDEGFTDEKSGLFDLVDLTLGDNAAQSSGRACCSGRWNIQEGVVADKKESESWWHTERPRWHKIDLN
jgi:hypothetical protein